VRPVAGRQEHVTPVGFASNSQGVAAGEAAKAAVTGKKTNTDGWSFWQAEGDAGKARTLGQVRDASAVLTGGPPAFISVFAGRIADTGRDPIPIMAAAVEWLALYSNIELIWASPRELLNIFQADAIGCHIITVSHDILAKLPLVGKNLTEYSLDTVRMFRGDAVKAGYRV
jgi:transaldolase